MNKDQMDIKTPEFVSLQFPLAGIGSRAAAFIIDQMILAAVYIVILIAFFLASKGMSSFSFFYLDQSFPIAMMIIAIFVIYWSYFFAFEFFSGGSTIGKKVIGIRVLQENGHSITLLASFIRNFMRIIDALPASYLLGFLTMFFHRKHKRLGDLVAGTIVIHERKAKRKKKPSAIEKEIQKRGLSKQDLILDSWLLKSFSTKDWKLISTYSSRFLSLADKERNEFTKQIANLLLPKISIESEGKTELDLENILLALYLNLKEEYEIDI